jgi:hypothetical protein
VRAEVTGRSKSSILDTSLTELAFIFFFILLLVSVWKLNEQESKLTELVTLNKNQQLIIQSTQAVSELIEKIREQVGEDNFEEYFSEIVKLKERVERAKQLELELQRQESDLNLLKNKMVEIFKSEEIEQAIAKIEEIARVKELISTALPNESQLDKALNMLLIQLRDAKGQNNNLRQQIVKLGNGLDHPPCWADSETGSIEYMFDVTILEDGVTFARGWPDSRNEQAIADPNIAGVIGLYNNNEEHLMKTTIIYEDSVKNSCRHFVRISDKAISKDAFKKNLLAIEKHFYKKLTETKYGN